MRSWDTCQKKLAQVAIDNSYVADVTYFTNNDGATEQSYFDWSKVVSKGSIGALSVVEIYKDIELTSNFTIKPIRAGDYTVTLHLNGHHFTGTGKIVINSNNNANDRIIITDSTVSLLSFFEVNSGYHLEEIQNGDGTYTYKSIKD